MSLSSLQKKYENVPLKTRAVIWFTVSNFFIRGINYITAPIFTRMLTPEEYGVTTVYYAYQQILCIMATWELSLGAYSRGFLKYKYDRAYFTTVLIILSNILTVTCFIPVFMLRKYYFSLTETGTGVLILSFIYFALLTPYNCWLYGKRFYYEYKFVVAYSIFSTIINVIFQISAIWLIGRTAKVKIASSLLIMIILYIPFYIKMFTPRELKGRLNEFKNIAVFCMRFQFPLIIHSFSFLILGQADRIMIGEMVDKASAGIYSVAYSTASLISIVQTSINQVFQPYRYKKIENGEHTEVKISTNYLSAIYGVIIITFILVAPEIIHILFPPEYEYAKWIIPPVALGFYFMFLYSILVDIESYYEKTNYVMTATVVSAGVNIILNYVGIKFGGYIVCGYTTMFCYMLSAVLHYSFVNKICRKNNINYMDLKFIARLSISVLLIGGGIVFTYNYFVVRYLILFSMLIISLKNHKKIIVLLHKIQN